MSNSYIFTEEDNLNPIYCILCHSHIPQSVSITYKGYCYNCFNYISQQNINKTSVLNTNIQYLICPKCYQSSPINSLKCNHCGLIFDKRFISLNNKISYGKTTCYLCGRIIQQNEPRFYREVYTGHSERLTFGNKWTYYGISQHYSRKILCSECTYYIDEHSKKGRIIGSIILIIILFLFVALLVSSMK